MINHFLFIHQRSVLRSGCTLTQFRRHQSTLHVLRRILGSENVLSSEDSSASSAELVKYTHDWTRSFKGGTVVALPTSTQRLSELMKFCYDSNIKVVPQGGNTSLSGGAIPISDEIIVSLEKMNKIVEIDQVNGVLVAEAGCVLQNLSTEVGKHNLMIPLDLGAKGSCMIGGNVATNAGGVRVMRYGSLHHNVLGLEVVLPDGRVVDMLKKLRKDNSGFPLKHVFIGSEGCLGIITKVAIQVLTKPKATSVVILKVDSFDKATRLLVRVREEMSEVVSAFEYLDAPSIQAVRAITPTLIQKLGATSIFQKFDESYFVLIEFSTSTEQSSLQSRIEEFLFKSMDDGTIDDSILSSNSSQEEDLWSLREHVPLALMSLSRTGTASSPGTGLVKKLFKYDVSLPEVAQMPVLVSEVADQLRREGYRVTQFAGDDDNGSTSVAVTFQLFGFGHIGDGNLHLNILMTANGEDNERVIEKFYGVLDRIVYKLIVAMKGSVSAEHGIGQLKRKIMAFAKSPEELALMAAIKKSLDPKGILQPGKVIPDGCI